MTHSLTHSLSDKVTYILSCPGQKKNKALGEVSPAIGPKKSVFLVQKNGGGEVRRLMEMPYFFPFLFVFPIESSRNSVELSKDREDHYRLDLYIFCFSLSSIQVFFFISSQTHIINKFNSLFTFHNCSSQPSMVHWLSSSIFPCSLFVVRPAMVTSPCYLPQTPKFIHFLMIIAIQK